VGLGNREIKGINSMLQNLDSPFIYKKMSDDDELHINSQQVRDNLLADGQ
jgi:hypothetical protein